jgi:DNA-binding NarL/FixJ family response regulator
MTHSPQTWSKHLAPARPLTILIADDSQSVSEMLAELISDPGRIEVIGFADSEDTAIDRVMHLKPDVVILDMQLRSGSGTGIIRAVRSSLELHRTKLVVMSNHPSPQIRKRCLELGSDYFFDKAKDFDLLTAVLNELLAEGLPSADAEPHGMS